MIRPSKASGYDFDRIDENTDTIDKEVADAILALDLESLSLLDRFEQMVKVTENCHLSTANLAQFNKLINSTAQILNLTDMQTVMLSPFVMNFGDNIDKRDLCSFFGCSSIELMRHFDEIETLVRNRYLTKARRGSLVFSLSDNIMRSEV